MYQAGFLYKEEFFEKADVILRNIDKLYSCLYKRKDSASKQVTVFINDVVGRNERLVYRPNFKKIALADERSLPEQIADDVSKDFERGI